MRRRYVLNDEVEMKKTVKRISGNPANISYWERIVRINEYFSEFSANSLRCHWRLMEDKGRVDKPKKIYLNINKEESCTDAESEVIASDQSRQKSKKIEYESPKSSSSELENSKSSEKKEEIKASQKKLVNPDFNENRIQEDFENLVDLCKRIRGKKVSEIEVLTILIHYLGSVKDTLNFYMKQRQNKKI